MPGDPKSPDFATSGGVAIQLYPRSAKSGSSGQTDVRDLLVSPVDCYRLNWFKFLPIPALALPAPC